MFSSSGIGIKKLNHGNYGRHCVANEAASGGSRKRVLSNRSRVGNKPSSALSLARRRRAVHIVIVIIDFAGECRRLMRRLQSCARRAWAACRSQLDRANVHRARRFRVSCIWQRAALILRRDTHEAAKARVLGPSAYEMMAYDAVFGRRRLRRKIKLIARHGIVEVNYKINVARHYSVANR